MTQTNTPFSHESPSCAVTLQAHHHNMLEFSVRSNDVPLSSVFNNLQEAKDFLQLQDFFVSQTTLDQVRTSKMQIAGIGMFVFANLSFLLCE